MNKEQTSCEIKELLDEHSLASRLEIIANILLEEGLTRMKVSIPDDPKQLPTTILNYKLDSGETVEYALAFQGLCLLQWVESLDIE